MKRIGIVGYGSVGQFLSDKILSDPVCKEIMELAFVWNRTAEKLDGGVLPESIRLTGDLTTAFKSWLADNESGAAFGDDKCFRISFAASRVELSEGIRRISEALGKLAS